MLRVLKQGVYTSIQDLGRFHYRSYGVPVAGAMDHQAAKLANLLIGNNENDAVLEITLNGTFELTRETVLCIAGADLNATLNDEPILCNTPVKVNANSILRCVTPNYGLRAYVAVKDGFLNKPVLGSRSFFKEITKKYVLNVADEIFYEPYATTKNLSFSHVKVNHEYIDNQMLEVYQGPEYNLLSKHQRQFLEQNEFTISQANSRMGYKLNELLTNELKSMLTSSMLPGTVQLTPSGTLIILMRDCGVTGGYPRILQLTDDAINTLAQKSTNDAFRFKLLALPL